MLDTLGDFLNPYKDGIAAVAGAATTLHTLSKAVFLNNIRKRGTADGYSAVTFLGGIVVAILNLELSFILGDAALIRTNFIGLSINIVCMSIFYFYTSKPNRPIIWKQCFIAAGLTTIFLVYALLENPTNIKARFSSLLMTLFVVLLGLPLLKMKSIIRQKNAGSLPFPMIVGATTISSLWLTYAISIKERTLIYQNGLVASLLLPQLIVCLVYPRTLVVAKTTKDKEVKKD